MLPVKSLVRFKCVCKSWRSLLSDPHFAISHFQQPSARTHKLLFIAPSAAPQIRSIDFNASSLLDDSASAVLNLNILRTYHVEIMGSCRGFLLLNCLESFWLWNPSTGLHRKLSSSPIDYSTMQPAFYTFLYGFGYDASTDDYLVIIASYDTNGPYSITTRFDFLSLRANAWRDVEAAARFSYMNCSDDIRVGSLLNGAIHWFAYSCDANMTVAVVFDLKERSFSEIPLPVGFQDDHDFNFCELGVLGELLSISAVGWNHLVDIWVMKEYKVQSSWTKTIVVSGENIPTCRGFYPMCFTIGGDIVGTDGSTGLAKCNDKGQLQEHRSYCDRGSFQAQVYTESLLSLPVPAEEDD